MSLDRPQEQKTVLANRQSLACLILDGTPESLHGYTDVTGNMHDAIAYH